MTKGQVCSRPAPLVFDSVRARGSRRSQLMLMRLCSSDGGRE